MFATTVRAEMNATLHVFESGLQDIRIFLGLVPKESPCTRMIAGAVVKTVSIICPSRMNRAEEVANFME
jgi:deoxycytidylate deaminase